jgi:hypothetical protein
MKAAISLAQKTGAPDDISTQAGWRLVAAMAAADEGAQREAETLIAEAVALIEPTDFLELRADVYEARAHVEAKAGRPEAWNAALLQALADHESKGNLVAAQRMRELIAKGPA